MEYQQIEYVLENGIASVKLNNPAALNAMSKVMGAELLHALERANKEARVLVLGSNGRAFCSGANLTDGGLDIDSPERDAGAGLVVTFNPLILAFRDMEIPVITAVRGAAAGIGCPIALLGDIVIAGKSTYFLQAFRNIGLVPDGGSAYVLSRSIGRVKAMEMMLLGKKFPSDQALAHGMVTEVVEDDAVEARAMEIAQELANGPTITLGLVRKSAWAALDNNLEQQLQLERIYQRKAGRTNDFAEGVRAFRDKRPAEFKGE